MKITHVTGGLLTLWTILALACVAKWGTSLSAVQLIGLAAAYLTLATLLGGAHWMVNSKGEA